MPLKRKPLAKAELAAYEAKRDLAVELLQSLLQSVREMKAGQVHVVSPPVIEARKNTGLLQSQFAALLGVSVRTLQGWQQGRKQPHGAAGNEFRPDQHARELPQRCRRSSQGPRLPRWNRLDSLVGCASASGRKR